MIFHTCTFCPKEKQKKLQKNSPDCQNLTVFRDRSILGRRRKWIQDISIQKKFYRILFNAILLVSDVLFYYIWGGESISVLKTGCFHGVFPINASYLVTGHVPFTSEMKAQIQCQPLLKTGMDSMIQNCGYNVFLLLP